jgi:hypothetical protein
MRTVLKVVFGMGCYSGAWPVERGAQASRVRTPGLRKGMRAGPEWPGFGVSERQETLVQEFHADMDIDVIRKVRTIKGSRSET